MQHLNDRALDDLVLQRSDPQRSLPTIGFRDVHATRRLRSVRSSVNSSVQVREACLEVLPVLVPRHAVNACGGLTLERKVCVAESIDCHVVQERREPLLPVPACCFMHTVERTERAGPALCPGRVLLRRVPLGRAPSLHPLLHRGTTGFVRGLHRYYEPV